MTKQIIQDGIIPNDGQGDSLRTGAQKINTNFDELYTALGNGSSLTTVSDGLFTATGSNKITFHFDTFANLPDATTYHGMFAHVHGEDSGYMSHAGAWVKLVDANKSIDALADVNTTNTTPTDGQALLWDNANSYWKPGDVQASGGGTFVSLSDSPSTFSGASNKFVTVNSGASAIEFTTPVIDKIGDVDTTTTPPTAGQVLKWNGSNWVPAQDSTSGGSGSDADTLDGLDSPYFLDYNNFTNKPTSFGKSFNVSAATYTAASGIMQLTIGAHDLVIGDNIKIAPLSLTFSCDMDNHATNTQYPRATGSAAPGGMDYVYNKPVAITGADATTITMNVGTGNLKSFTPTAAIYTPATGVMELTIGTHNYIAGNKVSITTGSLTFTCALDGHSQQTAYPRATGSAAPGGADYAYETLQTLTSVSATTITMNVGISSNTSAHTFVSASAGAITSSNIHTFVSATSNCVTFAKRFTELSDAPSSFSGYGDYYLKVNTGGTALELVTKPGGATNLSGLSDITTLGNYYNTSSAVYTPASGVLVLTIGQHNLQVGHNVKIASNSLTFTCAMDSHATEHTYPRSSGSAFAGGEDPAFTSPSTITAITADSITVNVGISSNTTAHTYIRSTENNISVVDQSYSTSNATYTPNTGQLQLTIGNHAIQAGHSVMIAANSLTFTCALDSNTTQSTYPRATGSAAPGGMDYAYERPVLITAVSATTITMNCGVSSNTSAHTFVSAVANNIKVAPTQGDSLYFNGVSWLRRNGPVSRYEIINDSSNNFTWTGPGLTSATNDPVMYMNRGHTYYLINQAGSSHPLEIRTSNGGSGYTSGVTGSQSGTQIFEVPMDAPATLYYQCTIHSAMGNTINILS